jgi:hypothetical protein
MLCLKEEFVGRMHEGGASATLLHVATWHFVVTKVEYVQFNAVSFSGAIDI